MNTSLVTVIKCVLTEAFIEYTYLCNHNSKKLLFFNLLQRVSSAKESYWAGWFGDFSPALFDPDPESKVIQQHLKIIKSITYYCKNSNGLTSFSFRLLRQGKKTSYCNPQTVDYTGMRQQLMTLRPPYWPGGINLSDTRFIKLTSKATEAITTARVSVYSLLLDVTQLSV